MKDNDQQVLIQSRMEQARAALEEADILFLLGKTTFRTCEPSWNSISRSGPTIRRLTTTTCPRSTKLSL